MTPEGKGLGSPQSLQQNGPRWETVVVDEFLPCKISYGQPRPVFAEPLGEEIWVALLEMLGSSWIRGNWVWNRHLNGIKW